MNEADDGLRRNSLLPNPFLCRCKFRSLEISKGKNGPRLSSGEGAQRDNPHMQKRNEQCYTNFDLLKRKRIQGGRYDASSRFLGGTIPLSAVVRQAVADAINGSRHFFFSASELKIMSIAPIWPR